MELNLAQDMEIGSKKKGKRSRNRASSTTITGPDESDDHSGPTLLNYSPPDCGKKPTAADSLKRSPEVSKSLGVRPVLKTSTSRSSLNEDSGSSVGKIPLVVPPLDLYGPADSRRASPDPSGTQANRLSTYLTYTCAVLLTG